MSETINWQDFAKVDIRVGIIQIAEDFEAANKPAYILHVDFGADIGVKKTSAQITTLYTTENLVGKQVIAVVNFPKKQIANIMSECLVLGIHGDQGVVLLQPEQNVENGSRIA